MSTVTTSCKDCIFAEWENFPKLVTQMGCSLGRIDKFLQQGKAISIEEDDKLYYVVQRFCNACRNQEWLEQHPNIRETIMDDIALDYGAIITVDDKFDFAHMQYTISSLVGQNPRPKTITIVSRNNVVPSEYVSAIRALTDITVKFTKVLLDSVELVNEAVPTCDNQYYVALKQGEFLPASAASRVNDALNVHMKQFAVAVIKGLPSLEFVLSKTGPKSFFFVNRLLHDIYQGNKDYNIVEKLTDVAKTQNRPEFILEV